MAEDDGSAGIIEVTKGGADFRVPPHVPEGRVLVYAMGLPFQAAERKAGLICNLREGKMPGVDWENGTDVILFDDLSNLSADHAVEVTRNHEEPNPNTDPPGQTVTMIKYPIRAGFVPLGAKRVDGSAHPHAGTGFGINRAHAWSSKKNDSPPYSLDLSEGSERYSYFELHQFSYDGEDETFQVVKTDRISEMDLIPGWRIGNIGITNAIPEGDDLLFSMVGGKPNGGSGTGVVRWRREAADWRPVSFTSVTGEDGSKEPSMVRDVDGALLFSVRGGHEPDYNDIRVWRLGDGEEAWAKVIHVRDVVSSTPISINQAADGTPFIAANLYEVFMRRADLARIKTDPEGRLRGGGWTRETLCIWPLNEDRTGLEPPIVVIEGSKDFGRPPGRSAWRVDHPSGMTVQLSDGKWRHILAFRVLEDGEMTYAMDPTPYTGCFLEEVISKGEAIPIWNFQRDGN